MQELSKRERNMLEYIANTILLEQAHIYYSQNIAKHSDYDCMNPTSEQCAVETTFYSVVEDLVDRNKNLLKVLQKDTALKKEFVLLTKHFNVIYDKRRAAYYPHTLYRQPEDEDIKLDDVRDSFIKALEASENINYCSQVKSDAKIKEEARKRFSVIK